MRVFDPCISQSELKVDKVILLHHIATQLPDVFIYAKGVIKSYILVANTLMRVMVPIDTKRSIEIETR